MLDGRKQEVKCGICGRTGKETYSNEEYPCGMCKGRGKYEKFVSDGPQLNLSNSNAIELIRHLGLEVDYVGSIKKEQLPELRKRLIMMLNSEKSRKPMLKDNRISKPSFGKTRSQGNVTSIGKQGVTMVDGGRNDAKVQRYAKDLLDIVDYAAKHGYFVSWS